MTRQSMVLAFVICALVSTAMPPANAAAPIATPSAPLAGKSSAVTLASTLLDHLDAGRFNEAEALFTQALRAAVPATRLQQVWVSLARDAGPAGPRGEATTLAQGGMTVVAIPLPYAKVHLVARISIDDNGKIAGFLVQPAPPPVATIDDTSAAYAEHEVSVGEGERALPGTLAMPKAASAQKPVPAVVLVHGSGPHDRDETIGPNRPFLDIARGLAAEGIAVLRYDKRTKVRPQDFMGNDFDVDDEVTDDAIAAVASLREVEGVDPQRVYVIGHSLGGMLAPRIARQSGHVAGVVLLAPPARPLLDVLLEQVQRQAVQDGAVNDAERRALDDLQARVARVRNAGNVAATETPLGLPAGYWRNLERIDPVSDALDLKLPILVLQGGRDIQVVDADWQRWQAHLSARPNASLRHYPAINHLGMAGHGPGSAAEYYAPGHVDAGLIRDIATWIGEH